MCILRGEEVWQEAHFKEAEKNTEQDVWFELQNLLSFQQQTYLKLN